MIVNFNNSLTQTAYNALGTKDSGTLYFTTDTNRLYKGEELYSENVRTLSTLPTTGVENIIYVINSGGNVNSYIWDGSVFKQIGSSPLSSVLTDVSFNTTSQIFKFTYADGNEKEIDLVLESVLQGIAYNQETKILTFTLVSGATTDISLIDLVDAYTGSETNTATVTIGGNGMISVGVKVSATPNNRLVIDANGLYVAPHDDSGKMNKVASAVNGNIGTLNASGQTLDSGKKFSTTVRTSGATNNDIPTELGVRTAINNSIEEALTWQ